MTERVELDRRQFAQQILAGTGCLGVVSGAAALADDQKPVEKPATEKADSPKKGEKPAAEAEPVAPELLLLNYLVRQYPNEHLNQQTLSGIYRDIRGDLARSSVLNEFPLTNADEPAFAFRAYHVSTDAVK
jgi:hypothetical protein